VARPGGWSTWRGSSSTQSALADPGGWLVRRFRISTSEGRCRTAPDSSAPRADGVLGLAIPLSPKPATAVQSEACRSTTNS
jgi:hypothetical protein